MRVSPSEIQLEAHFSNFCSGWGRRKFLPLSSDLRTIVFIRTQCCPAQLARQSDSEWSPCIGDSNDALTLSMCEYYCCSGHTSFWGVIVGFLQYVVLIPIVEIHRRRPRSPWCTIQATHSKWLRMKPLQNWFQRCINLWHSVSIRVIIEVHDAWFWLFWCQYNIHEFLRSTWPKIVTLVWRWERVKGGANFKPATSVPLFTGACTKYNHIAF